MKLVRFRSRSDDRIGIVVAEQVVDPAAALAAAIARDGVSETQAVVEASKHIPGSMREFLESGADGRRWLHEALEFVEDRPDAVVDGPPLSQPLPTTRLLAPTA